TEADLTEAEPSEVELPEVGATGVEVGGVAPGWPGLAVPPGWEAVAAVARAVHERRDAIAQRMTERIAAEVPAYRDGLIAPDDLRASVERNTTVILVGIAENRGPRDVEVAACGELGARRAL